MVKVNEHVAAVQHTKRADHRAIVVNTAQADTCMGSRKKAETGRKERMLLIRSLQCVRTGGT